MVTYSDSGVDISLEEQTVAEIAAKLKPTLKLRDIITESGHFAALVRLGDKAIAMSTDGVGSKILIAKQMQKFDTVGIDCIAMVVNDLLCVGAEPIALVDYLAVEKPEPEVAAQIAEGLAKGAEESKIAIIGGETASLPGIIKDFDLAGTGIGFVDTDKIITGETIKEGDILLGLESTGVHSNGLSLARRALLTDAKLDINDKLPTDETITVGEALLTPTQLYVQAIVELTKSPVNIKGLAHITGGGFNNLKRLKKGIGFNITNLPLVKPIFEAIYQQNVPLTEMYTVFNMGIGFVVILKEEESTEAIKILEKYHKVHKIGTVTKDENQKITIETFTGETIEY